jgi:hypothetical protein
LGLRFRFILLPSRHVISATEPSSRNESGKKKLASCALSPSGAVCQRAPHHMNCVSFVAASTHGKTALCCARMRPVLAPPPMKPRRVQGPSGAGAV